MKDGKVGLNMLMERHKAFVAQLTGDAGMVDRLLKERNEGVGYGYTIEDQNVPVGLCVLRDIRGLDAHEFWCIIDTSKRHEGYATFGAGLTLEFAFRNLRLDRVFAGCPLGTGDAAWQKVLVKEGFDVSVTPPSLTPERWREFHNAPRVAALHPSLRLLLDAELKAGNEIMETGGGWPDKDSVFIRLKHPFKARPAQLPDSVTYNEVNDAHWWQAEYLSRSPRHLLVH